jgi:hypothetical protein
MITTFMTVSGWLFWIVLLAFVLIEAFTLRDRANSVLGVALGVIALLFFSLATDAFVGLSLFWLLIIVIGYPVVGLIWAGYNWRKLILTRKAEARKRFDEKHNPAVSFEDFAKDDRPTAVGHADQITAWIGLWPWSMSWLVAQFPWRGIVWIWNHVSTFFERMSERLWKD